MKFLFLRVKAISNLAKILILVLLGFIVFYCQSQAKVASPMKILLPLYSYPNWYQSENYLWSKVASAGKEVKIEAIINPHNGPDAQPPNQDYQRGLQDLRASDITILGYVSTRYGDRPIDQVKQDIDLYDNFYDLDGIFLDESASDLKQLSYYQDIYRYIKTTTNYEQVVINPGTHTDEAYLSRPAADTAVIFEDYSAAWSNYQAQSYQNRYKSKHFASLIHSVPDVQTMKSYIDLAVARNIGYIYITDDSPDSDDSNPWNSLPSYWQEEVEYIQALK